jgi:hypothetical protein
MSFGADLHLLPLLPHFARALKSTRRIVVE